MASGLAIDMVNDFRGPIAQGLATNAPGFGGDWIARLLQGFGLQLVAADGGVGGNHPR